MTLHLRLPSRAGIPVVRRPQVDTRELEPTWRDAVAARIEAALAVAQAKNSGGWFVVAQSAEIGRTRTTTRVIDGREVALWRDCDGAVVAGPGACPHLGALLEGCRVVDGTAHCRWHGLPLGPQRGRGWAPYAAHDDGVLVHVRLPVDGEPPTERPASVARPLQDHSIAAVIDVTGVCEPRDVVANRLDPWHGSWFHPYAFSHLVVDDDASTPERLTVDVTFRLNRTWGVPVRAVFACPDSRTIAMHIVAGEGEGSVVETHATPVGPGADGRPRTRVIEATVAGSDRRGFQALRHVQWAVLPVMRRTARRLWVDDLAYAERRYELRRRASTTA